MLSEDFDNIFCYLSTDVYPKHVLDGKNCSHAKKNFRVKASQFQIGVDGKIFKEISVCFYNYFSFNWLQFRHLTQVFNSITMSNAQ